MLDPHTRLGNARTHLHKAVEAATKAPGHDPAISIQAHVHEARIQFVPAVLAKLQSVAGVTPETMHQDIRLDE